MRRVPESRISALWALPLSLVLADISSATELLVVGESGREGIVTHGEVPWKAGDAACVLQDDKPVACGEIVTARERGGHLHIRLSEGEELNVGDPVVAVPNESRVKEVLPFQTGAWATQPPASPWTPGEAACVVEQGVRLDCGDVVEVEPWRARVVFSTSKGKPIHPGFLVERAPGISRVLRVDAQARTVSLSQSPSFPWKRGEEVILRRDERIVARGHIVAAEKTLAKALLLSGIADVRLGDWAAPTRPRGDSLVRELSSVSLAKAQPLITRGESRYIGVGTNLTFPFVRGEWAISPFIGLGAGPSLYRWSTDEGQLQGLGLLLGVSYYRDARYEGMWFHLSVGMYRMTVAKGAEEDGFLTVSGSAVLGWRWQFSESLHAGVGFGAQALGSTGTSAVFLNTSGLLPSAVLDIGVAF